MTVFDGKYQKLHSIKATFADGTLPGWLETTESGAGSATVGTDELGRVRLNAGTASGDSARLRAIYTDVTAGDFDALGIRTVLRVSDQAATIGDAVLLAGMQNSDDSEKIIHFLNKNNDEDGTVEAESGGNATQIPTLGSLRGGAPIETELLYDTEEGEAHHRFLGSFATSISSDLPSESETLESDVFIQSFGTSDDCIVDVFEVEITQYRRSI